MEMQHKTNQHSTSSNIVMYKKLALMIVLSFIAMYLLMYSMVDTFSNAVPNVNQFYMAGLMTMPMLILELAIMGGMYMNKKLNLVLFAAGFILLALFFLGSRRQSGVSNF